MQSNWFGLGMSLVALGACSQASRSDTPPNNGSSTQGDNGSPADAEVTACTDVTGNQLGGLVTTDLPAMNGNFLPHGSMPPAPPLTTDVAPTCDKPLAMPPVAPGSDFHYQSYTFANDGDGAACVTVEFDLGRIINGPMPDVESGVQTLAYLDDFDAADITKNYIAGYYGLQFGNLVPAPIDASFHSGSAGIRAHFSFHVPAHAKFVVVVSGKEDHDPAQWTTLYMPYDLAVTNCTGQSSSETDAGSSSGGNGKSW